MLVRMVVLVLVDISRLSPFLPRLVEIAKNPNHPVFFDKKITDPAMAALARDMRVGQVQGICGLITMIIQQQANAGPEFFKAQVDQSHKKTRVDDAMRELGLD